MIIVKLIGGIGNQMFQYAAARKLSVVNNVPLKLDINGFSKNSLDVKRKYELHVFNIREEFATAREIKQLSAYGYSGMPNLRYRLFKKLSPDYQSSYMREEHFHFTPEFMKLKGNLYIDGYWQSEKYFKDIEDVIRNEFTINSIPDGLNKKMVDQITASDAVSLHVRRGDYVSNKSTHAYHGTCTLDYYHAAINTISKKIKTPHYYVFSDDPVWVEEHLTINCPATYVAHNDPASAYEDLRLLGLCNHHIIANSSFSWWGAWLGRHPGKIVIAPSKWFNDMSMNTEDLLPENWIKI